MAERKKPAGTGKKRKPERVKPVETRSAGTAAVVGDPPAGTSASEPAADTPWPPDESLVQADVVAGIDLPAAPEPALEPPVSEELKAIVEALIFAAPEPLTLRALGKVLASEPREDVERAVEALKQDYAQQRGLQLVEIAGGLQIVTRTDLNEWVRRLFHERKSTKLSVQALETLAVIAYRQPVTSAEITEIRGVNTSGVISTLVERKLIKISGRKRVVGRPFLYATTREFLMRFGLNDLSDLPKIEDMAELLGFDLSTALAEPMPSDQLLPLDVEDVPEPAFDPTASVSLSDEGDPAAGLPADESPADGNRDAGSRRDDRPLGDPPDDESPDDESPGGETTH